MNLSPGVHAFTWRFIAIGTQLIATIVLFNERYYNIIAEVRIQENLLRKTFLNLYFDTDYTFKYVVVVSGLCNIFELLTMTQGHPITSFVNIFSLLLHIAGTVVTFWMIAAAWPITIYQQIFFFCSVVPAVIALCYSVDSIVFKSNLIKRIDVRI